jgi:acyl carrier protein
MNSVERDVRAIVANITSRDVSALGREDDLALALGVDSLQGLQILAMVESRFDIRLCDDELIQMRTIARIAQAIREARIRESESQVRKVLCESD